MPVEFLNIQNSSKDMTALALITEQIVKLQLKGAQSFESICVVTPRRR